MVAVLAISAAFFYGLSMVLVRVGLSSSNTLTGILISLVSPLVVLVGICLFTVLLDQFATGAVLFFILAGISGPFIARVLFFAGINRVGSAIASSLYGTKTMFAAIAAVVILSERLTISIALATFIIIIGSIIISLEESGGEIEKKWSKKDLIFPIAAAACFGIAHVSRKIGLNITPEPIMGVTIQNVTALACFPLLALGQGDRQKVVLNNKRAWIIFSLSGFSSLLGQLSLFYALDLGRVVIVSPLSAISPFFVLLLVGIFLKKMERVTWKIVLGAVFIVAGAAILTTVSSS